jgi:hypothetical protein
MKCYTSEQNLNKKQTRSLTKVAKVCHNVTLIKKVVPDKCNNVSAVLRIF